MSKGKRHISYYILSVVYALIGIYFLLYSDYPLFIILFIGLSLYHFFLARVLARIAHQPLQVDIVSELKNDEKENEE